MSQGSILFKTATIQELRSPITPSAATSIAGESLAIWGAMLMGGNPAEYVREIRPVGDYSSESGTWGYGQDSQLYNLTREAWDRDAVLRSAAQLVIARVLSREVRVLPGDDSPLAQEIADQFTADVFDGFESSFGFDYLKNALLAGAIKDGVSIVEIIWAAKDGRLVPSEYLHCYPGQFLFSGDRKLLFRADYSARVKSGIQEAPENKFIILRIGGFYGNPWGESPIFNQRFNYYWRKMLRLMAMDFAEIHGQPILVARVEDAAGDAIRDQVAELFANIRRNTGLVLPKGVTVDSFVRGMSQGETVHERLDQMIAREMAQGIIGSVLTSAEAENGTRAQAQVHAETDKLRTGPLASELVAAIRRGLAKSYTLLNYGEGAPVPRIVVDLTDEIGPIERLEMVEKAVAMGAKISARQLNELAGIEAITEGEEVVGGEKESAPAVDNADASAAPSEDDANAVEDALFSAKFAEVASRSARAVALDGLRLSERIADACAFAYARDVVVPAYRRAMQDARDFIGKDGMDDPAALARYASIPGDLLGLTTSGEAKAMKAGEPILQAALVAGRLIGRMDIAGAFEAVGEAIPSKSATFAETEPVEPLPELFDEATNWLVSRKIVTVEEVREMARSFADIAGISASDAERIIRGNILALARVTDLNLVAQFRDTLAGAVANGKTAAEWMEEVDALLRDNTIPGGSNAYLQMVFRTEVANARHREQEATLSDPTVRRLTWGFEFFNPADARSRTTHANVSGLRVKLDSAAEVAARGGPPWAYQCRCTRAILIGRPDAYTESSDALSRASSIQRFSESAKTCAICGGGN